MLLQIRVNCVNPALTRTNATEGIIGTEMERFFLQRFSVERVIGECGQNKHQRDN